MTNNEQMIITYAVAETSTDMPTGTTTGDLTYNNNNNTTKATSVTLGSTWEGTLSSTDYASNIRRIDASASPNRLYIEGNSNANVITGGDGKNTLSGGKGSDVYVGGGDEDVFVYTPGDGADVINDYVEAEDTIFLTAGSVSAASVKKSSGALTLTMQNGKSKGTVKILDGYGSKITILDSNGNKSSQAYGMVTLNVADADGDVIDATGNTTALKIDASNRTEAVEIIGNSKVNTLVGSSNTTTTMTGGKGNDVFVINSNTVITDYTAGDKILTTGFTGGQLKNDDVIISTSTGNVTLTGAKSKNISVLNPIYTDEQISGYETLVLLYNDKGSTLTLDNTAKNKDWSIHFDTITASKRTQTIKIGTTDNGNHTIIGGKNNDTLKGGAGDDVLTGGSKNDLFIYSGGNDTITDYKAGQDSVYLDVAIDSHSIGGGNKNVLLNIGTNTLCVKNAVGQKITFVDSNGSAPITFGKDKGATIVAANANDANINANVAAAANLIKLINASKRTKSSVIKGNALSGTIVGGTAADTIFSGIGNNVLTGGKGADLFVYSGGNDTITDYGIGNDSIQIGAGLLVGYDFDNSNMVFSVSSGDDTGVITVKNGKNSTITFLNADGSNYTAYSTYYYNPLEKIYTAKDKDTIFTADNAVVTINAANLPKAIKITGNDKDNLITGGTKADTLNGMGGSNTLTGGKGNDVFVVNNDTAKTFITDYTAGDKLLVSEFKSGSLSGSDVIINGNVTLKGAKNKKISVLNPIYTDEQISGYETLVLLYNDKGSTITLDNTAQNRTFAMHFDTITASARTKGIAITGDSSNNTIVGGKQGDTISGGSGNNLLKGGNNNDVFVLGSGFDTISDFNSSQDSVFLSDKIDSTSLAASNKDLIIGAGSSSLYIKTMVGKKIVFKDSNSATPVTFGKDGGASIVAATTDSSVISAENYEMVKLINGSKRTKSAKLIGNDNDNSIIGGSAADTLNGMSGSNTLTGGKGNDVFYIGNGNDYITDYVEAQDSIHIATGKLDTYKVDGKDVILTIKNTSTYTTTTYTTATIKGGKDKTITFVDAGGSTLTTLTKIYNDIREKIFTASDTYTTVYIADTDVITIDATKLTQNIDITANSHDNIIKANAKNNLIKGGSGNDTITTGNGDDTYVYTDGDDVITDYAAGSDVLDLNVDISSVAVSSDTKDVIINFETGSLTVKNGVNQNLTIKDKMLSFITLKTDKLGATTLTADDNTYTTIQNIFSHEIDASKSTRNMSITDLTNAGVIEVGGSGDDTLKGGNNNDTLTGGAGKDLFIYTAGADVITDYEPGSDVISIIGGSVTDASTIKAGSNNNLVLTVSDGNTITLEKGAGQSITIFDDAHSSGSTDIYALTELTLSETDTSSVDLTTVANKSVLKADASALTTAVSIKGNDNDNTLIGGSGDDTLTGGAGKDVFVYTGGNDVITDYAAGEMISVTGADVGSCVINEDRSVTFNVGDGSITILEGVGIDITINETTQQYNNSSSNIAPTQNIVEDTWFTNVNSNLSELAPIIKTVETDYSVGKIDTSNVLTKSLINLTYANKINK